jgi:addiction module HigA family antidote
MKVYSDNLSAVRVVHPGLAVADELEALGITAKKASKIFGITQQELAQLCAGLLDITPSIANGLEQLGSAEAGFWLQLQKDYDQHPKRGGYRLGAGRKKKNFVSKQVRISAPPEEMQQIQAWLEMQNNTSQALAQLILHAPRN